MDAFPNGNDGGGMGGGLGGGGDGGGLPPNDPNHIHHAGCGCSEEMKK